MIPLVAKLAENKADADAKMAENKADADAKMAENGPLCQNGSNHECPDQGCSRRRPWNSPRRSRADEPEVHGRVEEDDVAVAAAELLRPVHNARGARVASPGDWHRHHQAHEHVGHPNQQQGDGKGQARQAVQTRNAQACLRGNKRAWTQMNLIDWI
jgi:hypothetical protein